MSRSSSSLTRRLRPLAAALLLASALVLADADAGGYYGRYGYTGGYGPSVARSSSYALGYPGGYAARGYGYSPYVAGRYSLGTLRPTYSSFYRPYSYGYYSGAAVPTYSSYGGYPGGYYGRYGTHYSGYAPYIYSRPVGYSSFYRGYTTPGASLYIGGPGFSYGYNSVYGRYGY